LAHLNPSKKREGKHLATKMLDEDLVVDMGRVDKGTLLDREKNHIEETSKESIGNKVEERGMKIMTTMISSSPPSSLVKGTKREIIEMNTQKRNENSFEYGIFSCRSVQLPHEKGWPFTRSQDQLPILSSQSFEGDLSSEEKDDEQSEYESHDRGEVGDDDSCIEW
jgi:hypothetical protein